MPTPLYNAGRPVGAYLDVDECRRLAVFLGVERRASRLPRPLIGTYVGLADLAMAATRHDGHGENTTSSILAADGHGFDGGQSNLAMLDSKALADLLGISKRHARRKCEQMGQKIGGRWIVDPRLIEKAS